MSSKVMSCSMSGAAVDYWEIFLGSVEYPPAPIDAGFMAKVLGALAEARLKSPRAAIGLTGDDLAGLLKELPLKAFLRRTAWALDQEKRKVLSCSMSGAALDYWKSFLDSVDCAPAPSDEDMAKVLNALAEQGLKSPSEAIGLVGDDDELAGLFPKDLPLKALLRRAAWALDLVAQAKKGRSASNSWPMKVFPSKCCPAEQLPPWDNAIDDQAWSAQPLAAAGVPTKVKVYICLEHLYDIVTSSGTAGIKLKVWSSWKDPRLAGRNANSKLPDQLWTPYFNLLEARPGLDPVVIQLALTSEHGDMSSLQVFQGNAHNKLRGLDDFPFDTDTLKLTLQAKYSRTPKSERNFSGAIDWCVKLGGFSATAELFPLGDWTYIATDIVWEQATDIVWEKNKLWVGIELHCRMVRNWHRYIWTLFLPLVLIAHMNILGLFIKVESLADRLSHTTGLFFATVALLYVVSAEVPKVEHRTPLDNTILLTIFLLLVSCYHHVIANYNKRPWHGDPWEGPLISCCVYAFIYSSCVLCQVVPPLVRLRRTKAGWEATKGCRPNKYHRTLNRTFTVYSLDAQDTE